MIKWKNNMDKKTTFGVLGLALGAACAATASGI